MAKPIVVLIPGICGSGLVTAPGFFGTKVIWFNKLQLVTGGPDALDLAADGLSPGPLASGPLTAEGLIQDGTYSGWLSFFSERGWDTRILAYDWRKPIRYNATAAVAALLASVGTDEFYIAAHSMGGLLARAMYPIFRATNPANQWKRTVYINTPHGGSYDASGSLADAIPPLSALNQLVLALGIAYRRISNPTASTQDMVDRTKQVIASWPGLYDLLPSTQPAWASLDPKASDCMVRANYLAANPHVSQAHLTAAAADQVYFEGLLTQPRPDEACIVCTNTATNTAVADGSKFGTLQAFTQTNEGDGVVPANRQQLPGTERLTFTGNHFTALQSVFIMQETHYALLNGVPQNKLFPSQPMTPLALPTVRPKDLQAPPPPFPTLVRRNDP